MMRKLAGIQLAAPGYTEVIISPIFDCGLDYVDAYYDSIHGKISVSWQKNDGKIDLDIEIPKGVSAKLCHNGDTRALQSGHQQVSLNL